MNITEARQKYIGKRFRVIHADRGTGTGFPYTIRDQEGICTNIEAYTCIIEGTRRSWFSYRIDIPGTHDKWFRHNEIEPVQN